MMKTRALVAAGVVGILGVGALSACGSQSATPQAESSASQSSSREAGVITKDITLTVLNEYPRAAGMWVKLSDTYGFSSQTLGEGETSRVTKDEPVAKIGIPHHFEDEITAVNPPFSDPYFKYEGGKEASLSEGGSKKWTSSKTGITYIFSRADNANGKIQMKITIRK